MSPKHHRRGTRFERHIRRTIVLLFVVAAAAWSGAAANAATLAQAQAQLLAAAGTSPQFWNEFDDLTEETGLAHPLNYSSNGVSYSIISAPLLHLYAFPGFLTTSDPTDQVIVSFTSTNLHVAGGLFFLVDSAGHPTNGLVRISCSDGTSTTLNTTSNAPAFGGFILKYSSLSSLSVQSATPGAYPAMDHFLAAVGKPAIQIRIAPGQVVLTWSVSDANVLLQAAASPAATTWTDLTSLAQTNGSTVQAVVPLADTMYFRLAVP